MTLRRESSFLNHEPHDSNDGTVESSDQGDHKYADKQIAYRGKEVVVINQDGVHRGIESHASPREPREERAHNEYEFRGFSLSFCQIHPRRDGRGGERDQVRYAVLHQRQCYRRDGEYQKEGPEGESERDCLMNRILRLHQSHLVSYFSPRLAR